MSKQEEKHQQFKEVGVKAHIEYVNFDLGSRVEQSIAGEQLINSPAEQINEKLANSLRATFKSVLSIPTVKTHGFFSHVAAKEPEQSQQQEKSAPATPRKKG